jgi:hypothetical protein
VVSLAGRQVSLTVTSVALAVGFAGALGVFFGFYPARRADPGVALRKGSAACR